MSIPVVSSALARPPEFEDPEFRRRRTQNWMVLGLLYAFFYMARYSLTSIMPSLAAQFGWTNTQIGVFETMMPFVYGLSVLINGPIADRVGGKRAFLFGAIGVAVMNTLFALETTLVEVPAVMQGAGKHAALVTPAVLKFGLTGGQAVALMVTTWAISGYFQSFGALSIVKVNAQWFHRSERGTFAGIFGVLIRVGLFLGLQGVPWLVRLFGVTLGFFIPVVFVAAMLAINYFLMENSPADTRFGNMDTGDGVEETDEQAPGFAFVIKKVFTNRAAWIIAFGSIMIGLIRRSTIDGWFPKYYSDVHLGGHGDYSTFVPFQITTAGIALLGIAGGFAFGIASDRYFASRRAPVITIGFLGMATTLAVFGLADRLGLGPWPAAFLLPLMSFFVNGAHGMIGGAASMDFGGKKAAATAAGMFDGLQYLGAAPFAGLGMGYVIDHFGWSVWQWVPIPFAILGAIILATLWNVSPSRKVAAPAAAAATSATRAPSPADAAS
jgi:MFS transporter, OPA family, glycerol-3-phosphate transporter